MLRTRGGRDGGPSGASDAERWLAEPPDAERERRGPAVGGAGDSPASGRWLAEPSDADRERRAGRA
ncbi:hypothetical protein JHN50_37865, partial [Streptomyces sp. MBT98]|nr:hypothetical protein [Streptomyces sp. MBT98]